MKKLIPRKFDRVNLVREVTVRVGGEGPGRKGNTVDASPRGVRLFVPTAIPIGESVEIAWPGRTPPLTIGGRVVQNRIDDAGALVGVAFHQPLDPKAFEALRRG